MDRIPISFDKPSTGVRVAQVVGITTAAYVAGALGSTSFMTAPALLLAPAPLLAKQWQKAFDIGKYTAPPLSILSGIIFGTLAYRAPKGSTAMSLYAAAAVLTSSIAPFTLIVIQPTNNKLHAKASSLATTSLSDTSAEAGVAKEETVHALFDKWSTLNLIRSILPTVGALCAAWAAVDNYEVLALSSISVKSGANRMG